jgi:uncharacterized protein YndB with AHSA1/START domain
MPVSTAANSETFKVTTTSDTEMCLTRLFDAPRALVFEAMTKPEHIARWWGRLGAGYSVPVCEVDLRVGGKWRFVNRHPKGEVAFHGEYREIVPDERIVTTEVYEMPGAEPLAAADEPLNIVTFTEIGGRTTLSLLAQTTSRELRDTIIESGMEAGMQEQMDLLEQVAVSLV